MRVTDPMRYRSVIMNLNRTRERMTLLQERLSTGKKINRPSDDPIEMAKALRQRTKLEGNIQFEKNIDDTIGFLSSTEAALNNVHEIMLRVKEIALQGASDSVSPRGDLAEEVDLILDNILSIANTKDHGKYIFAGTKTQALPFTINTNVRVQRESGDVVTYRGNNDEYERQLDENTRISLNIPGSDIFDNQQAGGVNLFQTIYEFRNALQDDDGTKIRSQLDTIQDGIDQVLDSFTTIGTRKQLAIFVKDRFQIQNINIKARLSQSEDTDFGEAFVQFKAEENALQSALSAGARVISPSLLDFIGI